MRPRSRGSFHVLFSIGGWSAIVLSFCSASCRVKSSPLQPQFPPKRIVSVAPNTTEILCAMGLLPRLVAVSTACDYPEAVKSLEKAGDFATPNVEKLLSLRPDLVVSTPFQNPGIREKLEKLGVPMCIVEQKDLESLYRSIAEIGKATGEEATARELVENMRRREESVKKRVGSIPRDVRPRVFVELSYNPIYTVGRSSFVRDLVNKAGGINVTDSFDEEYVRITPEFVIKADPDVILLGYMSAKGEGVRALSGRIGWSKIKAVRTGRVIDDVHPDIFLRPGPRVVEGLEQIAARLHPAEQER